MSSTLLPLRAGLPRPTATSSLVQCACQRATRAFGTSSALLATGYPNQGRPRDTLGQLVPIPKPSSRCPDIPPYPYGPRQVYKQSNGGLYGSSRIQFGNNISEKHDVKTPRKWRPNLQRRRLWSESLRCFVQTRVTMRVLRTIDKAGGLDNYLLGDKTQRIRDLGPWGWKLRWRIMQSETVMRRFADERVALGLAPKPRGALEEEALREATLVGIAPAGAPAHLSQELMAETQRMIDRDEDFVIGKDEGFMKEQTP
ncbi:hypothetical protein Daus18300_011073 [Diaporthe australafricana]|uniref:54S ribosomal protein L24 n=1 Tax=Diaporthe australafricana TaxID=127596 RepID=A0ABR3W7U3_9PEZI